MTNYFNKYSKLSTLKEQFSIIYKAKNDPIIVKAKNELQLVFNHVYNYTNSTIALNKLMATHAILREAKNNNIIEKNAFTKNDTIYKVFVAHNYCNEELKFRKISETLLQALQLFKQKRLKMSICLLVDIQAILISNEKEQGIRNCNIMIGSNENSKFFYNPPHYDDLKYLLKDWIAFFNNDTHDPIIDVAIMHYQFESIHPFLDGNGRIGRILCYLFLFRNNIISYPIVSMSNYFLKNIEEYYSISQAIKIAEINANKEQQEQTWIDLIWFFMRTVSMAIKNEINLLDKFIPLSMSFLDKLEDLSFFEKYKDILSEILLSYPYTTVEYFKTSMGISNQTALKYLKELTVKNILKLDVDKGRNFYLNQELFELLNEY